MTRWIFLRTPFARAREASGASGANEFLYALTFPGASFVPARSVRSPAASRALPGTGPYRVASFDTKRQIRLTRNPHFRLVARRAT